MRYEETVRLCRKTIDRVNALLSADFCREPSDEELLCMGASNGFSTEGIYLVTFEDGSVLNFDLCVDSYESICTDTLQKVHCFYDEVTWTSADGATDVELNCAYEIEDIEVEIDGNTYIVRIEEVA